MPRYAYQKPRAKVYAYNYGYMNNYYKPMTHYLNRESPSPADRPGAQSLAERLKKFPMDGSIYPDNDWRHHPSTSLPREIEMQMVPALPMTGGEEPRAASVAAEMCSTPAVEERMLRPLYLKHPYRLPIEDERRYKTFDPIWYRHPWDWDCIWVPPHESCTTPHFGLESAYNLITKFLRLKPHLRELTLH